MAMSLETRGGVLDQARGVLRGCAPVVIGALGAMGLLGVFLGALTLGNSFAYAWEQLAEIWYWALLLTAGFGTQLGLYSYVRLHVRESLKGATAEVAASGGLSTGSMLACCAHYLTTVLPLLGLSAAAVFLAKYQTPILLLGVVSNFVGITYMLYFMQKHGLLPRAIFPGQAVACDMKAVRNAAILASAVIVLLSFYLTAVR